MTEELTPEQQRRLEIIWLLEHRNDYLPTESRSGSPVGSAGFAGGVDAKGRALRSVTCPDCIANDRVSFHCETCGGSGEIPDTGKDPMDDPLKNPPPDPRRKMHWGGNTRIEDAMWRDRELALLDGQVAPAKSEADLLADANRRGYGWEEARRAMYRQHDFAALDRALDVLRTHFADEAHALNAVYVDGWMVEVGIITPHAEELAERGLILLGTCLPTPLRTALNKHPALIRRDRKHREAA